MSIRSILVTAAATALIALGAAPAFPATGASLEARARAVVGEFFRTINAREFGRTCDLMSARFYKENHIPNRKRCVLGLTVTFTNTATIHVRILGVRREVDQVVVKALANGAPGTIVVVREAGGLKILSVGS
jgi:hypothetical protein